MAIEEMLDSFGKKLAGIGQNAPQQKTNHPEVDRLNGVISEKQQEIGRLYFSIGETYYDQHKGDDASEFADQITQIAALTEELESAKQDIEKIERQEKCPVCGAEYVSGSAFCHVCGTKIIKEEPVPEGMKKCPQCGALVENGHAFCTKCGSRLEEAPAKTASTGKKCPQCGALVESENSFCTKCGSKL